MQIKLPEISMAYEDAGEGIPLLFVHGYPLTRKMWAPQIGDLAQVARVLAPDLRGHGDSTPALPPYSMEMFADDLLAFLDVLEISGPVVLCGLSMGGYAALAFYRKYRARLAGLILAASRAGPDTPETKANRDRASQLAEQGGIEAIIAVQLPKMLAPATYEKRPQLVEQARIIMEGISLPGILGDLAGMKERPDSSPLLPGMRVPLLIVQGDADQFIPLKEAEALQASAHQAQLAVIPDAGHLLNLEQPQLFNQAVSRFIKTLSK